MSESRPGDTEYTARTLYQAHRRARRQRAEELVRRCRPHLRRVLCFRIFIVLQPSFFSSPSLKASEQIFKELLCSISLQIKTAVPGEKTKRKKQAVQLSSGSAIKPCSFHPDWLLRPWITLELTHWKAEYWAPLSSSTIEVGSLVRSPGDSNAYSSPGNCVAISGLCPWEPLGSKDPGVTFK